jgi:hypothetical protein
MILTDDGHYDIILHAWPERTGPRRWYLSDGESLQPGDRFLEGEQESMAVDDTILGEWMSAGWEKLCCIMEDDPEEMVCLEFKGSLQELLFTNRFADVSLYDKAAPDGGYNIGTCYRNDRRAASAV